MSDYPDPVPDPVVAPMLERFMELAPHIPLDDYAPIVIGLRCGKCWVLYDHPEGSHQKFIDSPGNLI